jgi:hypothetical protein
MNRNRVVIFSVFALLAVSASASIPSTGRSSYGSTTDSSSTPGTSYIEQSFQASSPGSDFIFAFEILYTGSFQFDIKSTSGLLDPASGHVNPDNSPPPPFGAFTTQTAFDTIYDFWGPTPSSDSSYTCSAGATGSAVPDCTNPTNAAKGFNVNFTVPDQSNAACNPGVNGSCLTFYVLETSNIEPTAILTPIGVPEPGDSRLVVMGVLLLGLIVIVRPGFRLTSL